MNELKGAFAEIWPIIKKTVALSGIIAAIVAAAAALAGYGNFALGIIISAPVGIIMLWLMARQVASAFNEGYHKKVMLKFIFRLACFAILLYLLIGIMRLNPFGVSLGITMPVFAMMAVIFVTVMKEKPGSSKE